MKSMRPEDRPKAIVLIVLVVAVFVGIYMRLSSAFGGPPQPAPNAPVAENIGTPSSGAAAPSGSGISVGAPPATSAKSAQIEVPTVSPAVRDQDPFRSPSKTAISSDQTSGPANPSQETSSQKRSAHRGGGGNRITEADLGAPSGQIGSGAGGSSPALPTVGEIKPDEPPPITVTGIVDGGGGRSVAVIRIGAKDYVVATGDHFGDGFRLVEAYATSVVVTWSKEHRVERKKLSIELPGMSWDEGAL